MYFSLDKNEHAIGFDQNGDEGEEAFGMELDATMRDASFVGALGEAFCADDENENGGFPVIAAAKRDLSGYYAYFHELRFDLDPTKLSLPYTGTALFPSVRVKADAQSTTTLADGVDYVVFYKANTQADTGEAHVVGAGAYTGSKVVKFQIWKPVLAVQTCDSMGNMRVVKRYRKADFEAHASDGDPVSALYSGEGGAGGWRVSTAKIYVTFDDLFADAGVTWGSGS